MNISISKDELVDIRDVKVNTDLPMRERIIEYVRQIKNPYLCKCRDKVVHMKYANNGVSLEDCLERIFM